jgi:hypothetical protein
MKTNIVKLLHSCALLMLAPGLITCAQGDTNVVYSKEGPTNVVYFGKSDDVIAATTRMFNALKFEKQHVEKVDDEIFIWARHGAKFILLPKSEGEKFVGRIFVMTTFFLKDEYVQSEVIQGLIKEANRNSSTMHYGLMDDGKMLSAESILCYTKSLDLKLLDKFCKTHDALDVFLLNKVDQNAGKYFK